MKFFILALIYLFANRLGLPFGLEYTMLFAPFLYLNIFRKYTFITTIFFGVLIPFFIIHSFYGIEDEFFYLRSTILHLITFIIAFSFYDYLSENTIPEKLFKTAAIIAIILAAIGGVFLFTEMGDVFWKKQNITLNITNIPRFRGLSYEPAYFAYILTPVFFYYFDKVIFQQEYKKFKYLIFIAIPMIIAFSFSFIACSILSIFLLIILKRNFKNITTFKLILFSTLLFIILILFFPNNIVFARINDFLQGDDISGTARIFDPWIISQAVLEQKNSFFGIGFGQYKVVGHDFANDFYNYLEEVRIDSPNAVFDTLVTFGYIGLFLRFALQIYLFRKTKVLKSNFRTLVFFYAFIFQFIGGYMAMLPEYIMWILAFNKKQIDER